MLIRVCFSFVALMLCFSCSRGNQAAQETSPQIIHKKLEEVYRDPDFYKKDSYTHSLAKGIAIILDPGHGGKDGGTRTKIKPYIYEKQLVLETAKVAKKMLQERGYQVFLTREKDLFIPLSKRVVFAKQKNGYLFVSIHYNSAPDPSAHGIEIYYSERNQNLYSQRSKELAKHILNEVIPTIKGRSRGIKSGNFHVLRENKEMPAVLLEAGFLSNGIEAKKIQDPEYRNILALGIAKGIDSFIQKEYSFLYKSKEIVPGVN